MTEAGIALLVLGVTVLAFMVNRLPVGIVALGCALALWATGLLTLPEAMAGFGDPVIVFIATLFVVSEGIDSSGVTAWAGGVLAERSGQGGVRLLLALMGACALLTALISLNGSVAALLPMVMVLALRTDQPPSRLLMPTVYAGSAGSLLVLMGSPVNVLVSDVSADEGAGGFAFFEFAWVGVPVLLGTMLIAVLMAPRVVPVRSSLTAPPDLGRHPETLAHHYGLYDGFYRLRVRPGSPWIGRTLEETDLSAYPGVRLTGVQRSRASRRAGVATGPDAPLAADDVLVLTGPSEQVGHLAVQRRLAVGMRPGAAGEVSSGTLVNREMGVVEVVVPPRSALVGETVEAGTLRHEDVVILAVQRRGADRGPAPTVLEPGDALLVYGSWPAVEALNDDRDVIVVDSPDLVRRQAVALGAKARPALVVMAGMVLLLGLGLVPPAVAGLLGAGGMVLTGVVSSQQAYRAVSWETVVLVGALIPLSGAVQGSGAADLIADRIVAVVGGRSEVVLVATLFVLTVVLGLVLSNTATALIVVPIALAVAADTGLGVQPVLMTVAVAASAALLTPVQTPANMMIMAPGGYRFGDYWRLGLPVTLWWLVVSVVVIPWAWPS